MSGTTISALSAVASLTGTETLPVVQSSATARATVSQIVAVLPAKTKTDVAAVLADTTLTYTASQPGTVTAGDIITTRKEGISYEVAASGATDHHVTTAGSVKLYVVPTPVVDARAFGIIGGVDETTKLEALRQFAISYPGTTFDFRNIATKELRYTTPKWLAEVQDVTVDLTGISLRNLGAGTYSYSDMDSALLVGSGSYFHDDQGTGQFDPANAESGHLFSTVSAGATSLSLVTAAEDTNYSAGDRVLLRWLERQGAASFPPNPGYFEWLTVESVSSGTITFTTPLKYGYQAQAPDYTSGAFYLVSNGPARILNLTRTGYTEAGKIKIIGGIGIDTGAGTAGYRGSLFISGVAEVEVEGGNFQGLFNNCTEKNTFKDCVFSGGTTELDKVVGEVVCENVWFDGISQGTGVEHFEMRGGKLTSTAQMRMKNIALDGVDVLTTASSNTMITMDAYPTRRVEVVNCRFVPTGSATSAIQGGNVDSFTPDAITQTQITVNTGNAAYVTMMQNVAAGNVITLNNGKPPEHFYVTGFSFDGSNNLLIAGYCEVATPTAGARVHWRDQSLKHGNNEIINPPSKFKFLAVGRRVWHIVGGEQGKVRITQNVQYGEYNTVSANCYVERVVVDVVKPYTGADATCTLATAVQGAGQPQNFITANGLTAGRRMIDKTGQYGAVAGDTLTALPGQAWCEDLIIHLRGDAGTGAFTDGALGSLPLIRVTIEGYKPPFDLQEL